MQIEGLSWFPGHMTKTKRMIVSEIGHMDAVCEIVDARIPQSSRNLRILACGGTRITAVFAAEGDVLFGRKKYRSQSATGVVCRFWSAVNRGLRPRGTLYILTAKSTKNSPADAFAYFVPSNVRNGRLFAGLQANRPRFLPLLAGTSFRGSGIGPGPFAAVLSFRPGKEANTRTKDVRPCSRVRMFAQNRTENRTESEPKLPATMRIPVLNRARVSSTPSRRVP